MCKILRYRHSCGHNALCLLSRCRGTYQKGSRIECSMIAACQTTEYLCLTSPTWCGPCQYQQWNAEWDDRLRRARKFHAFVRDHVCPGEGEESPSLPEGVLSSLHHCRNWRSCSRILKTNTAPPRGPSDGNFLRFRGNITSARGATRGFRRVRLSGRKYIRRISKILQSRLMTTTTLGKSLSKPSNRSSWIGTVI